MTLTERIVRSLNKLGPGTANDISADLQVPVSLVRATLSNLKAAGKIKTWGSVRQGARGQESQVYELTPCTPK